jgi:hypothetical protein
MRPHTIRHEDRKNVGMNEQITDPGIEFYLRELHHLRPEADNHYAAVANGIQERINAFQAKLKAELEQKDKVCAEMRDYISVVIGHYMGSHNDELLEFIRSTKTPLRSDCGQGWHSPAEWEQVQKECGEMRHIAQTLLPMAIGYAKNNPVGRNQEICGWAKQALVKGQQ